MKILIAEDDLVTRELLKRVLTHMADEIIEANDGLEALEIIEREDPDFLFTDIQMPALDGKAIVEAVRSSKDHRLLPIVCMSSVKDKDEITALVALGIQDYILKPIRPVELHERFSRVISAHSGWRRRQVAVGRTSLLLVDPDAGFRAFAVPILSQHFSVVEATSGAHALRIFKEADPRPETVLISRGLPLIGEVQLKSFIGKLAASLQAMAPRFWLVGDEEAPAEVLSLFDGFIQRSVVAETFTASIRRTLLQGTTLSERLEQHLAASAQAWLVSSMRQVLGTMSRQEVSVLKGADATTIGDGVASTIFLEGPEARVRLLIASTREDACALAAAVRMKDDAAGDLESATEVFGELSTALTERAVGALAERGFELQGFLPEIKASYSTDPEASWHLGAWFVTASGQRVFVGLSSESLAAV